MSLFTPSILPDDLAYEDVNGDYDLEWWKHGSDTSPDVKEKTENPEVTQVQSPDEDPGPGWTVVRSRRQPKTEKVAENHPSPALKATDHDRAFNAKLASISPCTQR